MQCDAFWSGWYPQVLVEPQGQELLGVLRAQSATRVLPVIIVTARDVDSASRALLIGELGCREVFQKGKFDTEELVAAINAATGRDG